MDDQTSQQIRASRERSIEHVRRAIETVRSVIEQNLQLARDFPSHRDTAEARVIEGKAELAVLEAQLADLERKAKV